MEEYGIPPLYYAVEQGLRNISFNNQPAAFLCHHSKLCGPNLINLIYLAIMHTIIDKCSSEKYKMLLRPYPRPFAHDSTICACNAI